MSNSSQPSQKIPAVRTYAKDLELKLQEKGLPPEKKGSVVEEKIKAPVVAATAPKKAFEKKVPEPARIPTFTAKPEKIAPPVKASVPATKSATFIVENEDAASATVITDMKHKRFKLFPALFNSISKWFEEKKLSYQTRKQPKYKVPETSRRKGVIQKATSSTGKFADADFSSIHERIRQRDKGVEEPGPTTTWSANTEPGYPLLEGEVAPKITNVQVVSRKSFRTPAPVIPEKKEVVEEVKKEVVSRPEPVMIEAEPEVSTPVETPEEVKMTFPEESEVMEEKEEKRVEPESLPAHIRLLLINTNVLALGISGLVIAFTIVGLFGYFRIQNYTETNPQIFSNNSSVEMVTLPSKKVVITSNEQTSYLSALATVRTENTEATQVVFIYSNETEIQAPIILSTLQIPSEQNFKQSISQLRFGYTKNSNPFILLQSKDKAIALGGLLTWEDSLYADFNKVFSTSNLAPNAKFIDGSISGHDVRILKSSSGAELLVYGLVDSLIIITTDSSHFSELLNVIK